MNYLSHYYVADCPNNTNYTVGLLLPDFLRKQSSKFRIANEPLPQLSTSSQYFHKGVLCHYKVDELFHRSDFFKNHLANIQAEWKAYEFESLRKYKFFLAHVLLEMILDRILMKANPNICELFYKHLANINKKEYDVYSMEIGISRDVSAKVFSAYKHFLDHQYLQKYLDNIKIINGLSHIYEKFTHLRISNNDKTKLVSSLHKIEVAMQADYKVFLFDLKNNISDFVL